MFQDREHTLACKKQDLRLKEDEVIRIKNEMEKELALVKKKADSSTRKLEPGSSEMESLTVCFVGTRYLFHLFLL